MIVWGGVGLELRFLLIAGECEPQLEQSVFNT